MRKILYIFLCILLCKINACAYQQIDTNEKNRLNPVYQKHIYHGENFENLFSLHATDAVTIKKGSLFYTKSDSDIISGNYRNNEINFVSIMPHTQNNFPKKIVFRGKIIKNQVPNIARSGEIKIKITKIVVNETAYPVKATIKKANNKKVLGGIITGASLYPQNVKNAANYGNSYMNKRTANPCEKYCDIEHPVKTALNLTKGAIITTSSIVAAPIIGLLGKGDNVYIKKMSDFVIEIDDDISVAMPNTNKTLKSKL